MNVVLVGHRGVGKSTVGRLLAERLGRTFVDLDEVLEGSTGSSAAELVASDEAAFRKLEVEALRTALSEPGRVIAPGAGIAEMPEEALVIWLKRDGWIDEARDARDRLRPELSWEEEVAWMTETREPRWAKAAHLVYRTPVGRSPERTVADVATLVGWVPADAGATKLRQKTWVVVANPSELDRAVQLVQWCGFAGVELRSDVFDHWPEVPVPALASLRTPDRTWLERAHDAAAIDIDTSFIGAAVASGIFAETPRRLVISTHPDRIDPDDVSALTGLARQIQVEHPTWARSLQLKYAPRADSFADVGMGWAMLAPLRRAGVALTYIPQGSRWSWARPMLAAENASNYVAATHRGSATSFASMDLQDWLPHMAGATPTRFDALLGWPATGSQGPLWHRRAALDANEPTLGYVAIDVAEDEFDGALTLLHDWKVRGLSITSPHKRRIGFVRHHDAVGSELLGPEDAARAATRGLPVMTGNTLVRVTDGWIATDTDEHGMAAAMLEVEDRTGLPRGTVALFGRGGVTPAVRRAIEASGWFVVLHVGARQGWPEEGADYVSLIVNAAGNSVDALEGAPRHAVWLDLHYNDVRPNDAEVHLAGDAFFEAQAAEQRNFWRDHDEG